MEVTYKFLSPEELNSNEFIQLQNKIHGEGGYDSRIKRMHHYAEMGDYRVLVAICDGMYIGQASAYKVIAIIEGKEQPVYWGCDTFLLSMYRGHGIGKKLQLILHKECKNFSSAWYSPTNGFIKRKCGGKELLDLKFTYYPVSNFLGVMWQLASFKLFHKRLSVRLNIPFFYYNLNIFFHKNKMKMFEIVEIDFNELNEEVAEFMEKSLVDYDFHIKRNLDFLKWAYGFKRDKYHMLAFKQNGVIESIVAFSTIHNATHVVASFKGISILDLIISPSSTLTKKDVLLYVIQYHKEHKLNIEGLITLEQMNYFPKFIYPMPTVPLLSTYGKKLNKGYVSFIDQDMDQL